MTKREDWPLPPSRLEQLFTDKKPALDAGEASTEANRCLYCYDAPCITACPTSIDIPTFIRKIGTGNVRGSARTILSANLLGASCSTVCPVEVLCEGACVYNQWGRKPIEIGRLQRFAMERGRSVDLLAFAESSGKSIGLVGGGPASLACAGTLVQLGHEAIVYERGPIPGGLNVTGVAPYKLRAETALAEVQFIRDLGVEIRTGVDVGTDVTPEELKSHDAVFLGLGLGDDSLRGIPEAAGGGVLGAVEWIRAMKLAPDTTLEHVEHAVVVGGGNTALDVVQEMAGLGVPHVTLVYRRREEDMPGYLHEWNGAKQVKVRLVAESTVGAIQRDPSGTLHAVGLADAKTHDATGELPCDLLVVATGQERLQEIAERFPGVRCDERGRIQADAETLATANPRVFTGGDCYNGGKEVVNAADEGQRAARAIDALLRA